MMEDSMKKFSTFDEFNPKFQLLTSLLNNEFERVRENVLIKETVDNPIFPNSELIITHELFH